MDLPTASILLDDQVPSSPSQPTCPFRRELFNCHTIDLSIIRNDRGPGSYLFRTSKASLKCVHNVFDPVINIMQPKGYA